MKGKQSDERRSEKSHDHRSYSHGRGGVAINGINRTNEPRGVDGAASRIQVQGIYADPPNWTLYHTLHHTLYYPIYKLNQPEMPVND